jgi:hypothetical protein
MARSALGTGGSTFWSLSHRRLNSGCYWPMVKTAYANESGQRVNSAYQRDEVAN